MRKHYLPIVIIITLLSVSGLVFTQVSWLKKSVKTAEQQYDDRADRMLHDVIRELEQFSDTTSNCDNKTECKLIVFDAIDTLLLKDLFKKYCNYHMLDSVYSYALVRSIDSKILYSFNNFTNQMETQAYKACLSCVWKKEYIRLSVYFPNKVRNIFMQMYSWVILTVVFIVIILGVFIFNIINIIKQKRISQIRNDFINNMTHEFKTPISTISLAAEILMRDEKLPEERLQKYSKIIYDENKRMQAQVELVLQTALIERKKIKLHYKDTDVHELLKTVAAGFSNEITHPKPVFTYKFSATLPNLKIDPNHIHNVISNIIDNSIKYSGKNTPAIKISTNDYDTGITICLSDNGIGMSREAQQKVFEKFYRVSTGNLHDVKGFGLGLYYVKLITEAHSGTVFVESALNKGSTFCITIPRR